jgi:hypothetical protein
MPAEAPTRRESKRAPSAQPLEFGPQTSTVIVDHREAVIG